MTNPNSLRLDTELSAIGLSDEMIDAFGARTTTNLAGVIAMRAGIIDAARIWEEGETELMTSDEVRETREYSIGFDAVSTIVMGRMAA